jgi:hypothetical protein
MIIVQIFFTLLLVGPMFLGWRNRVKFKGTTPQKDPNYVTAMVNSGVLYALAFNIIFFLQELFLVLGKKALGLQAFLYHNNHIWTGEHPESLLMQGTGALGIFLVGLICLFIFRLLLGSRSLWKPFFLWLAFNGLIQSIPQVMAAYFAPNTDVGEALVGYLNLSQPVLIGLALVSMMATALISIWFSRPLLGLVPDAADLNNPRVKVRYIGFVAAGASIIGSILVVPFKIPPMDQAINPFIVLVFSVPWMWSAAAMSKPAGRAPNRINEKIQWAPIALLAFLLIFFRLVLAPGVEF